MIGGDKMKSMKVGWVLFPEYCRQNNIKQNGQHSRKLETLAPEFKEDLSQGSTRPTWAVNVNEADKVFKGGM